MKKYRIGNLLRGGWEGEFESLEEAWSKLGSRFLLSYPCEKFDEDNNLVENPDSGRYIQLYVFDKNQYGIEEFIRCKDSCFNMSERVQVSASDFERVPDVAFF